MSDSLCSFENDSVPKVRKRYTITKQREKWTEEEHQRFLEALKLYGRGWRQIEEHVGTKTAVQIRSHAQKFFSKMVRDSNGSAESSIKPIEIPPPRPKRKPAHPYPRKSVDSLKGIPVSKENCTPSNALVSDKNVQSPTSVLSTFGSDSLGAPASDQQNGCSSPTSCTTEMHSVNLLPTEKENEYGASKLSPKAENVSTLSTQLSVGSNMEKLVPVKIEPKFKDPVCTQEDAAMGPNCTSIKLFGRTVLVTEFQKPNSVVADSYKSVFKNGQGVNTVGPVPTSPSKCLDTHLSLGTVASTCNPSADGALLFACMELPEEKISHAEASPESCLPWCPLYEGVPLIHLMSNSQNLVSTPPQFRVKEWEDLSGKSCTGSSTSSVSELENREKSSDVAVDSLWSPSSRVRLRKCTKGFVPYKRCLTESGIKSLLIASEDRERQGTRVCS